MDPAAAPSLPPDWAFYAIAASLGALSAYNVVSTALAGRLGLFALLRRPKAVLFVALGGAAAAALLLLLRFLDDPATRVSAITQVLVAALGSGLALGSGRQRGDGRGNQRGADGTASVSQVRSVFDVLLERLLAEVRSDTDLAEVRLVGQCSHMRYTDARKAWTEHLIHLRDLDAANGHQQDRSKLQAELERLDAISVDDDAAARDGLVYLVLNLRGEKLLNILSQMYAERFPPDPAVPVSTPSPSGRPRLGRRQRNIAPASATSAATSDNSTDGSAASDRPSPSA